MLTRVDFQNGVVWYDTGMRCRDGIDSGGEGGGLKKVPTDLYGRIG